MTTLTLFPDPPIPDARDRGIFYYNESAAELPRLCREHKIDRRHAVVVTDPPWDYVQSTGATRADNHYPTIRAPQIVRHLADLHPFANRLCMWGTWPTLPDFFKASIRARLDGADASAKVLGDLVKLLDLDRTPEDWRERVIGTDILERARAALAVEPAKAWPWGWFVTGGSWLKSGDGAASWNAVGAEDEGQYGQGYHWAGCDEPVLQFVHRKAKPVTHRTVALRNAWIEPPDEHSRKPVLWQEQWIRKYTDPGDWIIDPYGGLASTAEAALRVGERFVLMTDIAEKRHRDGLAILAQVRVAA